jgi:Kef-type K+ transport system membrane component KefB
VSKHILFFFSMIFCALMIPQSVFASSGDEPVHNIAQTLLWIVVLLIASKLAGVVERFGQPAVLGELIAGVILGNLVLIGVPILEPIKQDALIRFLAELGVIVLLFQVGWESDWRAMSKLGARAILVACVGVAAPFALAMLVVAPYLLPTQSFNAHLFLAATLAATSVGITARVFRDLGKLQTSEARIVLGAAVIDDVLGLVILAVVSALVTSGTVSVLDVAIIILKAISFLVGAFVLGQLLAPKLAWLFSRLGTGVSMKFTLALCVCLMIAFLADRIGLAPIIGAFAAGIILDPVHFRFFEQPQLINDIQSNLADADPALRDRMTRIIEHHGNRHVTELIAPLEYFLAPLFFVLTGMDVRLDVLFAPPILLVALGIAVAAFFGKIIAGSVAGRVNKWIVGWGMVPRGEVGLIFAATGKTLGVVDDQLFSIIIIVVIVSTLATPPVLAHLLKSSR